MKLLNTQVKAARKLNIIQILAYFVSFVSLRETLKNMKPIITIEYCPKCNWLLRAAYVAQELLTTFANDLKAVQLQPSETAGKYAIFINDSLVFDRKEAAHFIEITALKQLIRDHVNPTKLLVHSDKK